MNKRLRELAEQAGAIRIHGSPKDHALVGYENIEKFAELIVQETLNEMGEQMGKFGDDQSNNPIGVER